MGDRDPLVRQERFSIRQPLPRAAVVDRHQALVDESLGKRVIHLGFCDELMEQKRLRGTWLHARLQASAARLVGLDISRQGVEWAQRHGLEAHRVDMQSELDVRALLERGLERADVVIAGELIEHLEAPALFLRSTRQLLTRDGVLILTTPNAFRLLNALTPPLGSELVHPDHVAWYSPTTLRVLLNRMGYEVDTLCYCRNPLRSFAAPVPLTRRLAHAVGDTGRIVERALCAVVPQWSPGLFARARACKDHRQ